MTADTESRMALPAVPGDLLPGYPDEFDLDIRWGELDQAGTWVSYLPTAREVPGETCDTHAATCPNTCQATCQATCHATCPATCHATCEDTCHTCEFDTCGATCAGTHCPTCSPNCHTP
jgi:hypothetical protein